MNPQNHAARKRARIDAIVQTMLGHIGRLLDGIAPPWYARVPLALRSLFCVRAACRRAKICRRAAGFSCRAVRPVPPSARDAPGTPAATSHSSAPARGR